MEKSFKPNFLKDKVAMITGGHGGMLFETAKAFLLYGASVAIMSRKKDKIDDAVANLKKETGSNKIFGTICDVREPKSVEDAIDNVLKEFGRIDILVNGAAGNFLASVEALSYNAFKNVILIDLIGTFNVTKAVYHKYMKEHGGSIINFSAALYQNGVALQSHAGAAKAGVDALTKHFATEFGPKKIRVNSITPGAIDGTEGFFKLLKPQMKETAQEVIPMQRFGHVRDIANAALFLASDSSEYITGQNIFVDGGMVLTGANFPVFDPEFRKMWKAKL